MSEEGEKEDASELFERIIKRAAENAFDDLIWRLEDIVKAFDDAADRLTEEHRRLDMMRSEMARENKKANGRTSVP
jgi:hypothetical protein